MMSRYDRRQFLARSMALAGAAVLPMPWVRAGDSSPPGKAGDLIVRAQTPFNAEPQLNRLVEDYLTPVDQFFVRSHAPVPRTDLETFRLTVEGLVHRPLALSVAEIRDRFRAHEVTATLTCAGNRRSEHAAVQPMGGLQWDAGAISTTTWTGASLADLLAAAGVREGAKHVWFQGRDQVQEKDGSLGTFDGSIPLERLQQVDPATMPLVAYGMGGRALTPDHGFPLRTVVPGYVGARSVKWLGRIVVSDRLSANRFVATDYKIVPQDTPAAFAAAEPIYSWATNAAICSPGAHATLAPGRTTVRGYALAAGLPGCRIETVELSLDGGRHWTKASLGAAQAGFNWVLWSADVQLPPGSSELVCRATDSRGFTMPERVAWNARGYQFNAWHRVPVIAG